MSRLRAATAVLIATVAVLAGCGGGAPAAPAGAQVVRVAAAADLKFALEEVAAVLAKADPPVRLQTTYGSSGTFFQQISNGAPFDVFLSADLSYPTRLAEAGRAAPDDVFAYAVGRLVVWVPNGSPVDVSKGLTALADPAVGKVAIANPEHAPYGRAAVAAMRSAGVYDRVESRLVLGENVAQAAEFAASGNAGASVIALSLALAPQLADRGRHEEVPLPSFPRLDQGGVVLAGTADRAAAVRLREFLTGEQGTAILKRYGFYLPGA
ncbi:MULTISPECIES: molybdate ABC transporter substrate-binding protein [Micromonospora]|uniref:Molybdate ABC transporter substrate-binding protein n=1 Tax=Micromonospora solifontis TaxID=2487138 RepID=A0ABX9WBD3_9ACTN|nr:MULTISPECIES: molybdate ABC transporter substrate-binding protein [Micromonospora]NES17117.1 molybdate ABC transporter substrate-binding protein [Micromonospora sp. PPF5-17B]NES38973.1 molybdate ABC transporter substrate-binding protein [Micromonospora solifontis]NES58906.1 molybdate ABC transporter substrate-binding protein [Micromonospora sp. PPF5-6]RNL91988.1 molybdate ABC transporter substrate-binding protein [Micromonospora solifontis]